MRVNKLWLAGWLLLSVLVACTQLGIKTPTNFNERTAVALSTVTASRQAALTLLQSGQITGPQAQKIQADADLARGLIDEAIKLHAVSPAAGEGKLETAQNTVRVLKAIVLAADKKGGK